MTEKIQNGVSEQLLLLLGGQRQRLSGNPGLQPSISCHKVLLVVLAVLVVLVVLAVLVRGY